MSLGRALRDLRTQRGWTLQEMSRRVGVPVSTLSKVERDRLSLKYDRILQISARLGLEPADLLAPTSPDPAPKLIARRSIGRLDQAIRREAAGGERYFMCPELRRKRMAPVVTRVRARTAEEFGELVRHEGEVYVHVMQGPVEVHTEFYDPVLLQAGESIYMDAAMGHAFVAPGPDGEAEVLEVWSGGDEGVLERLAGTGRDH